MLVTDALDWPQQFVGVSIICSLVSHTSHSALSSVFYFFNIQLRFSVVGTVEVL